MQMEADQAAWKLISQLQFLSILVLRTLHCSDELRLKAADMLWLRHG